MAALRIPGCSVNLGKGWDWVGGIRAQRPVGHNECACSGGEDKAARLAWGSPRSLHQELLALWLSNELRVTHVQPMAGAFQSLITADWAPFWCTRPSPRLGPGLLVAMGMAGKGGEELRVHHHSRTQAGGQGAQSKSGKLWVVLCCSSRTWPGFFHQENRSRGARPVQSIEQATLDLKV